MKEELLNVKWGNSCITGQTPRFTTLYHLTKGCLCISHRTPTNGSPSESLKDSTAHLQLSQWN
jgi:hypothetical protein